MTTDPPQEESDPADPAAVQADDELINALNAGVPVAPTRVTWVLSAWKADIDAQPLPLIHHPHKPWLSGVALALSMTALALVVAAFALALEYVRRERSAGRRGLPFLPEPRGERRAR